MIHLSLRWIFIFEPKWRTRFRQLFRHVSQAKPMAGSLFEYEFLWQEMFESPTKKSAYQKKLRQHPLHSVRDLQFEKLLKPLFSRRPKTKRTLLINPGTGELFVDQKRILISHPVVHFLQLLRRQKSFTFADVMSNCFQIEDYDSFIHDPKVNNLIQRVKKEFGFEICLTKNKTVFPGTKYLQIELATENPQPTLRLIKPLEKSKLKETPLI
jgi:hypothetical protein